MLFYIFRTLGRLLVLVLVTLWWALMGLIFTARAFKECSMFFNRYQWRDLFAADKWSATWVE